MSEVPLYGFDQDKGFVGIQVRLGYRGTSVMRNSAPLGSYSRTMPRAMWKPKRGGLFLMSEKPL